MALRITEEEALALETGIREFNEGFYFEAHDTLEEAWHGIRGAHRAFYHGLIQMATGFYHLTGGNLKGAESQLSAGLRKLHPFCPACLGVDVAALVREVEGVLERMRGGNGPAEGSETLRIPLDPSALARQVEK